MKPLSLVIDENLGTAVKRMEKKRQSAIKRAQRLMKRTGCSAEKAGRECDLLPGDIEKLKQTYENIDESRSSDRGYPHDARSMKKMDQKHITRHLQNYGYSKRNLPHLAQRLTKIHGKEHIARGNDIYVREGYDDGGAGDYETMKGDVKTMSAYSFRNKHGMSKHSFKKADKEHNSDPRKGKYGNYLSTMKRESNDLEWYSDKDKYYDKSGTMKVRAGAKRLSKPKRRDYDTRQYPNGFGPTKARVREQDRMRNRQHVKEYSDNPEFNDDIKPGNVELGNRRVKRAIIDDVRSADKKPEKYIGPDGKPRIRMVPVDRTVVKSEN